MLCSIAEYFYELCHILTSPEGESKYKQGVKLFTAILHNKRSNKRFIIQHTKLLLCPCGQIFADIYFRGMRVRSMRSGMELVGEIQLTDWSTAGEEGKLVFVVLTKPSLAQIISLFTMGEKLSFDRPTNTSI